jgi:hypothetical protein
MPACSRVGEGEDDPGSGRREQDAMHIYVLVALVFGVTAA